MQRVSPMRRLTPWLVPAVFCLGGLALGHHPMVVHGGHWTWFRFIQPDVGDARFVNYMFEHAWKWITGAPNHDALWSPPFYWPAKGVGAYSEILLGGAPLYWLWRALGFEWDTSMQLWVLSIGVLNFASAHWLYEKGFGFGRFASAAGAALFAFGAPRINQVMHYHLFPHVFTVVAVMAVLRLFPKEGPPDERTAVRWIWALVLSGVWQLWASIYLGWYLALGLAVAALFALALPRSRARLWGLLRGYPFTLAASGLAAAALLLPLAREYFAAAEVVGVRTFEEALTMIPQPKAWLDLGPQSWWYGKFPVFFQGLPMEHEQRAGVGLLTTGVVLVGLWKTRAHPVLKWVTWTAVALVLVSTLFGSFTGWRAVYAVFPGAQSIRAVARIVMLLLVAWGAALAFVLERLREKGRGPAAGAAALAIACILEQGQTTDAFDKHFTRTDVAAIVRQIPQGCEAFFHSPVDSFSPYFKHQIDAMLAELVSGVPTMNGYSGSNPPGWALGDPAIRQGFDEQRLGQQLQSWVLRHQVQNRNLCWLRVGTTEADDGATFVRQEVPAALAPGQQAQVSVTFRNEGLKPWRAADGVGLGSQSPRDNAHWGPQRVALPEDVPPGGEVTFRFTVTAPQQPTPFQWRMIRERVRWFGEQSAGVTPTLEAPAPLMSTPPAPQ